MTAAETKRRLIEQAPIANVEDSAPPQTIACIMSAAGFDALTKETPTDDLVTWLRALGPMFAGLDDVRQRALRLDLKRRCSAAKIRGVAWMIDAALGADKAPPKGSSGQGQTLTLDDPEPWPDAVDGAELLEVIRGTMTRYLALPQHAAVALALWVLHTYAIEVSNVSPILAITSPQKGCGKSRVLELLTGLVNRPLPSSNITAAAVFRSIEALSPTLLIDEADNTVANKDDLRCILNSGHTRAMAQAIRVVGDDHEPRTFCTYGPKAIAAIGALPPTIEDRAVSVRMQRRTRAEPVEKLRRDRIVEELEPLRRRAVRWVSDRADTLRGADPDTPGGLQDRAADNWRPLLAIADAAGGEWPVLARRAAVGLSVSGDADDTEAGVMLLADLQDLFTERGADRLKSATIIDHLVALEDRPWPEWRRGKPLTAPGLAQLLRPFGAKPKSLRLGSDTAKGYNRSDLLDPWNRYLPPAAGDSGRHAVTTPAAQGLEPDSTPAQPTPCVGSGNTVQPLPHNECAGVSAGSGGPGWETMV